MYTYRVELYLFFGDVRKAIWLNNDFIYIYIYSAMSALKVIRCNWCFVMKMSLKQMQIQILLQIQSIRPVSTR